MDVVFSWQSRKEYIGPDRPFSIFSSSCGGVLFVSKRQDFFFTFPSRFQPVLECVLIQEAIFWISKFWLFHKLGRPRFLLAVWVASLLVWSRFLRRFKKRLKTTHLTGSSSKIWNELGATQDVLKTGFWYSHYQRRRKGACILKS